MVFLFQLFGPLMVITQIKSVNKSNKFSFITEYFFHVLQATQINIFNIAFT